MTKRISIEKFKEMVKKIFSMDIEIVQWTGWTQPLCYICPVCGKHHYVSRAQGLLCRNSICTGEEYKYRAGMFSERTFIERVEKLHPEQIEITSYTGLGQPLYYKCKRCGQIKSLSTARKALECFSLCPECDGREKNIIQKKIYDFFRTTQDYKLINWTGHVRDRVKIQCLKCQSIFERYPSNVCKSLDVCPNCNNGGTKQKLDITTVQQRIDKKFGKNQYTLIEYKGQLNSNNKVRCENCGFIFNIRISSFLTQDTRGCPKCKRFHSKGEQMVEAYLKENNIMYSTQKRYSDCNNNLSSFDFCVYDSLGKEYLIEVNGVQHYQGKQGRDGSWSLSDNQRRDKIKQDYCARTGKQLIIIPYYDLKEDKIEQYLSFLKGSTTIANASNQEIKLEEINNT